ncbi:hypothetical protein K502DRAFT_185032 [Neoconidiobolus thromboides FSU 785]|nr:hypothetical protein K502DRAFT_185032 [Neoconidiobolus thromboides FSU 785]
MFKRIEKAIKVKEEGWDSDSGSENESDDSSNKSLSGSEVSDNEDSSNSNESITQEDLTNLSITEEELQLIAKSIAGELSENKELKCELCPNKLFHKKQDLELHLNSKKHMLRKRAMEKKENKPKKKRARVARRERRAMLTNKLKDGNGKLSKQLI